MQQEAQGQPRPRSSEPGNFIALDVETANANMASICSIGLVHFRSGDVARRLTILVNPEGEFDPINMSIHGIGPEHVKDAKTLREILPVISSALAAVVVVHHTHFDRVALCQAAAKHGLPDFTCRWIDSARVARRAWSRFAKSGYGLANLASEFGIDFQHHDACEDARVAGLILLKAIAETGIPVDGWFAKLDEHASGRISRAGDPNGPLVGDTVAFTGQLTTMTRSQAADLAAAAGMEVGSGVTRETSILVVGDQDISVLAGHLKSAKHRKAEQLISEGAVLRIICETDFKLMVGAKNFVATPEPEPFGEEASLPTFRLTPEPTRISLLVDAVTKAKREGRLDDACIMLKEEIENQEVESRTTGLGVAPWYYEQLAVVYRKQDRHQDELAVLERYDRQIKAPGATPALLKARLEKVRAKARSTIAG
jgi:DNA polymerase-3 subunit epsilon